MKKRTKDLAFALKVPLATLREITKGLDINESKFYNNWDEPKTDEKGNPILINGEVITRPINAPIKRLKAIQSKVLHTILYEIKLPDYFFGGIKKKDAVLNARHHQGNKYFFLTDLKNFYPSISHKEVEKALRRQSFYPDVAKLITRLSTKQGMIPQGCPTSSFLAGLVVYTNCGALLDSYISEGFKVSLFVDDLTISSQADFKSRSVKILEDLRKNGLKINFEKTSYCTKNPVVTGVQVKNNGIAAMPHTYELAKDNSLTEAAKKGHSTRIKYIDKIAKRKRGT